MIRNTIALLPLAVMFACQSPQTDTAATTPASSPDSTNVTATATEGEWVKLFDGETTNGWHTYGQNTVGQAWQVEDGTLHLDASNKQPGSRGDLVTDKAYDDFDLKLDWKISEGGNSGIIFYVHEDTAQYNETWNTGLEMQVVDNERHPDAKIQKHRAGDLYDLIAANPETVKPAGEWNQAEIVSKDGQLDLYLNGTKVVSTTLWDDNWKELVAGSKFASMPGFGTYKSGKIALQDHGNDVWFRNIMIKEL
ncbi:DUF1080 domain-containing protein [Pontibacter sp. 172403-2]|uniref:3-keto-disaccharide hydrolase n=1 Tax=Pontibacter rufus TaxID=2791028 RepID=UPI0018AFD36A|nr:DUF1080 domain-containing protein [Pontibacter sp. 172403-2]MBF9254336.1 DUF1080 domain-containing protein [Pontibacter sp. 172403-2]